MSFAGIVGQPTAVGALRRALKTGRAHHAYRFEGPKGVGKHKTAMCLAQALLCTAPRDGEGCGTCSACVRAVTLSTNEPLVPQHPDVIFVALGLYDAETLGRKSEESRDISVNQIRRVVLAQTPFPPHEGRARVFIVHDAELMNLYAANALLKTLEEPPPRTHFLLLTSRPDELLDTIRSRTLAVRFGLLGDKALGELLAQRGVTGEGAARAVARAGGSAAEALASVGDDDAANDERAFVEAALLALSAPDSTPTLKLAEQKLPRDAFRSRLVSLGVALAERARAHASPDEAVRSASRYSLFVDALDTLERNPAQPLLLEALLLKMRAVS